MADWGEGDYEGFAEALQPAADRLLELAAPAPTEQALDVGCGSGNATIPLAARAAATTGLDPSARLLRSAAARAERAGRETTWVEGAAEALPLPDDAFDLVVSVFGVIFTPQPAHALDELLRVTRPEGRIVLAAWRPEGAIAELGRLVREALPEDPEPARAGVPGSGEIAWHDVSTYASLVPGGEDVITVHEETLEFRAPSGAAWMAAQEAGHPVWLATRRALDDEDAWRDLLVRSAALLDSASTDAEAMVVPSPYRVVELRPDPG